MEVKYYRSLYFWGFLFLPLFYWRGAPVPFEVPKGWFLGAWVAVLSFSNLLKIFLGKKPIDKSQKSIVIFVGLYLLVSILSSLTGGTPVKSFWGNYYRVDGFIHLIYLLLLTVNVWLNRREAGSITTGVCTGSLVVAIWAILQWLASRFLGTPAASFGNPNFLAGYLAVTLPFWLYWKKEQPRLASFALPIILLAIIATASTGGILAAFLGIAFWVVFAHKRLLVLFSGILMLAAAVFAWALIREQVTKPLGAPFVAESRERIFTKLWLGFLDKPLLGWGVANVDKAFESHSWPIKFETDVYVDKAHSHLLEMLVTTGVVGLAAYVALLVVLFTTLLKNYLESNKSRKVWYKTLIIVLLVYVFHTQTNVVSVAEDVIFWTLLGLS